MRSEEGRPPLVLHWYPKVDRWVDHEFEYRGRTITGGFHESGYERPDGVYDYDAAWGNDLFEKRLTDTELTCEWWAALYDYNDHAMTTGLRDTEGWKDRRKLLWDRLNVISRMLEFDHYDG